MMDASNRKCTECIYYGKKLNPITNELCKNRLGNEIDNPCVWFSYYYYTKHDEGKK